MECAGPENEYPQRERHKRPPPGTLLSLVSLTVLLVQVLGDEVVKDTLTAAPGDIGEGTHDQRGDDDENHDDEHGNESSSSHCSCPSCARATSVQLNKSQYYI